MNSLTQMAADMLIDRFPELAEKHCPHKHRKFCGITEGKCKVKECPKILEEVTSSPT